MTSNYQQQQKKGERKREMERGGTRGAMIEPVEQRDQGSHATSVRKRTREFVAGTFKELQQTTP